MGMPQSLGFAKDPVASLRGFGSVGGIQVSNEKNLGCLVFIGDEILPSYIGIISFQP